MKRWLFFPFVVAVIAAMASLGTFGGSTAAETGGQVGIGKVLFLSLLAFGGAVFIGWMAFLNQKQKRKQTMPAERPWKDDGTPDAEPFPEEPVARQQEREIERRRESLP